MNRKFMVIVALVLVLSLTLTGCAGVDFAGYFAQLGQLLLGGTVTAFANMEYTRPDMEKLQTVVDDCCGRVSQAENLDALVELILDAYEPLDAFSTAYALANIHYSRDLTDPYWAEEYAFCSENAAIAQAALDRLYRELAKSPFRAELEGDDYFGTAFFDDYMGESFYDDIFTGLLAEEAALESEYFALWSEAGGMDPHSEEFLKNDGQLMEELYVELVAVRQKMAAHLGYGSYPEFAYDYYYDRDYTCDQTTAYLADVQAELVPLYRQMVTNGVDAQMDLCDEASTLAYVRQMASSMGGTMKEAFDTMQKNGLYDISYSDKKANTSFEIYISSYYTPFVFLDPTGYEQDKLTFAHEFGHFCCDYASYGSGAGVDVAEVFSQGMEYLSLTYVKDVGDLDVIKMVDSLSTFVEQAAYASFEQQVYSLPEEELTAENIRKLFGQVGTAYGFDSWGFDSRSYVMVSHFFTSPMYVIGYVVSNDVALQIYEMELMQHGSGLACLENNLTTRHSGIVAFAEAAGLESPFAAGRMTRIKEILRTALE